MTSKIRVVHVDDDPSTTPHVRALLRRANLDFELTWLPHYDAITQDHTPEVVLLDLHLGEGSGETTVGDALRHVLGLGLPSAPRVIVLTGSSEVESKDTSGALAVYRKHEMRSQPIASAVQLAAKQPDLGSAALELLKGCRALRRAILTA